MALKDTAARAQYNKEYRTAHKDALEEKRRAYYEKNKERISEKARQRYLQNKEQRVAEALRRQKEDPGAAGARNALCRLRKINRVPAWMSKDDIWLMEEIYKLAKDRIKATGIRWDVDHIYPIKGKYVSGLHTPDNLRVVPYKVNKEKRNRLLEACDIIPSKFL